MEELTEFLEEKGFYDLQSIENENDYNDVMDTIEFLMDKKNPTQEEKQRLCFLLDLVENYVSESAQCKHKSPFDFM